MMAFVKLYNNQSGNSDKDCDILTVILTNFTNGEMIDSRFSELRCSLFTKCKESLGNLQTQKILVAKSERLTYVGQNFASSSLPDPSYSYLIGIHKRGSKKMRLVNANKFILKPSFSDEIVQIPHPIDLPGDKDMSFRQKTDRLVSSFGSSKRKRTINSRLNSKVDSDMVRSSIGQLAGNVVNHGVFKDIKYDVVSDEYSIIPPCNKDAASLTDVYQLHDIISEADMDSLSEVVDVFILASPEQCSQWAVNKTYCGFILQQLAHLPVAHTTRCQRAKHLLYLHYMISLFHMKPAQIALKKAFPDDWPSSCVHSLKDRFVGEVGGSERRATPYMTARHRDRLAAHILTLCLILDEYMMPLEAMRLELKFNKQKISYLMQMLGCVVKRKREDAYLVDVAVLQLPLVIPKPRAVFKKKQ